LPRFVCVFLIFSTFYFFAYCGGPKNRGALGSLSSWPVRWSGLGCMS